MNLRWLHEWVYCHIWYAYFVCMWGYRAVTRRHIEAWADLDLVAKGGGAKQGAGDQGKEATIIAYHAVCEWLLLPKPIGRGDGMATLGARGIATPCPPLESPFLEVWMISFSYEGENVYMRWCCWHVQLYGSCSNCQASGPGLLGVNGVAIAVGFERLTNKDVCVRALSLYLHPE